MQNQLDILRDISGRFEQAAVPYVLTGSLALNYYLKPREVRDKDIVIALPSRDASLIGRLFSPDYYVSLEAIQDALSHHSLFCVRQAGIIKVDCIVRNHDKFRAAELQRRNRIKLQEFETWIASKEDLIISTLAWARDSHLDFESCALRDLFATGCDKAYLHYWIEALCLPKQWEQCAM